jgi:O-antigen ligase
VAACVVLVLGSQSSAALALVLLSGGVALWNNAFGTLRSPAGQAGYIGSSVLLVATGVTVFTAQVDLLTSLLGRSATLSGRTDIWASAWDAASTRPLHGYGFGGVWGSDVPPTDEIWRQLRFEAFHAHNGYLDLFLQVGLIGIALFLVAVGATLARTLQERTPGAGWAAAITFVLAVNAIGESGPFFGGGFLLLALFAVAAAQAPVREGTPAGTATPWDRRLSSSSR